MVSKDGSRACLRVVLHIDWFPFTCLLIEIGRTYGLSCRYLERNGDFCHTTQFVYLVAILIKHADVNTHTACHAFRRTRSKEGVAHAYLCCLVNSGRAERDGTFLRIDGEVGVIEFKHLCIFVDEARLEYDAVDGGSLDGDVVASVQTHRHHRFAILVLAHADGIHLACLNGCFQCVAAHHHLIVEVLRLGQFRIAIFIIINNIHTTEITPSRGLSI